MTRKRLLIACVGVAIFLIPSVLWAQEEEENPSFQSGWGPFTASVREGVWTQWFVKIVNPGRETRRVRVGCPAQYGDGKQNIYTRTTVLPAGCARETSLAFRPGAPQQQVPGRAGAEQKYFLWDARTGRLLQTAAGMTVYLSAEATCVGSLAGDRIEHDESRYLQTGSPGLLPTPVQLVSLSPASLPDRWYGYSPLKLLALGNVRPDHLRPSQVNAMLRWVRHGGCLLLLGGENLPALLAGPPGRAAGVRGLGVHATDSLRVVSLLKPAAEAAVVSLPWPLPRTELYAVEAQVLYEADALPLLTLRRVGEGCILTSAVPLGALKPQGTFNIWPDLARAMSRRSVVDAAAFLAPGRETLQQIAGRRGPSRTLPAAVPAAMAGATIFLGVLLRRFRRGEWLWGVLVPLSLAVGAGLFLYSRGRSDPPRLSHIGLITGLGSGQARIQETFAYYAGPKSQTVRFSSGSPDGLVSDLGTSTAAAMKIEEIRTTDTGTELPDQHVIAGDTRIFHTQTVEPFRAVSGSLHFDENGLSGELTNALSADIEDAVLLVNYRTYRLGTLPARRSRAVRIGPGDLLGPVRFSYPPSVRGSRGRTAVSRPPQNPAAPSPPPLAEGEFSGAMAPNPLQTSLVRRLLALPEWGGFVSDETHLLGYTVAAGADPLAGRNFQRQGWSVVDWPVSIEPPPPGRTILLPAGWTDLNLRTTNWDARHQRFIEMSREAKIMFSVAPPKGIRLRNTTAELAMHIQAGDYRLRVLGIGPTASRLPVVLGEFERPNGEIRLRIPDADRFHDVEERIVLQLEVSRALLNLPAPPLRGAAGPAVSTGGIGSPWLLHRMDISLKGTVR